MRWPYSITLLGVFCGFALSACSAGQPEMSDGGDAGPIDAGIDAGEDAGVDAGVDAGIDAGESDAGDAGPTDAGVDAGMDAGGDSLYGHGCSTKQDATGLVKRIDQTGHEYYTYAPLSYDAGTPIPVVISLHGAGDTAANFVQLWETDADQKGFLVLVPEASAPLGPGYTWDISDTNVILGAMNDIDRCYNIDVRRHILHGFSAGGIIGYLLGLSQSPRFSGLAIASSDLGTAEYFFGGPLLPSYWLIPVSIYHGEQDPNFPFAPCAEGSRDALIDAGHVVHFHPFMGGHTTNAADALQMYEDLESSMSPSSP
jgi:poly(3-hydroxybutyrate) depolymerase